ncbi:MAG: apolipoprotein N-acyltransferase [Porticoccaceae bacterium]|nr:apolipoprotein N-acyltransferase [Porticoccaceae bacterium]
MRTQTLLLYLGLLIAGGIFPLSLAPFSCWPVAIISMAALFLSLPQQSATEAFKRSVFFGLGMFGTGVSWVFVSMYFFGDISFLLALMGTFLFCFFNAVVFAVPFSLCALIPQRNNLWLLALPAIWVLSEWTRSWLLTGFPWLYAGYSHTDTWLSGWAPIGGVFLLSYFTALAATVLAHSRLQQKLRDHLLGYTLIATIFLSGLALQTVNWTEPAEQSISVALIQPNVSQSDKWSPGMRSEILRDLTAQTNPYWGTEIIIWPEGAIPIIYTQVSHFLENLHLQALSEKTALITGLPTNTKPEGPYYNSMLVLGEGHGIYNKTRLVPFGEYVPFETLIRGLNNFFDLPMSSFSLGNEEQKPLMAAGVNISTAICYEIAYPDLVARNTRNTNILLTVSNDAWFGDSVAPAQHMQMARMRAIENAKPVMRGTNNGITALVDHRGRITDKLDQFTAGVLTGKISPHTGHTPFSRLTSWPVVIISLLIISMLGLMRLRTKF